MGAHEGIRRLVTGIKHSAGFYDGKRIKKTKVNRFTRSKAGNVMWFTMLLVFGLFSILPLVYSVATSLKPLDELMIFPPRFLVQRPTIENYVALPTLLAKLRIPFSRYLFNSLFVSVVTTVLHVIVSAMASFVLAKSDLKGRNIFFWMIQFALLYNSYTLAVPQYLIFANLRMINTYWVYILPYVPSTMGVFLMKQFMEKCIPDSLLEAARIDGAGYFHTFCRIVMPMVKPAWLTLVLFAFRDMWAIQPQGTIFDEALKTLPYVMSQITSGGIARAGSAMAATVILMIPPIIVYLISQSNVIETMSSAGIKE